MEKFFYEKKILLTRKSGRDNISNIAEYIKLLSREVEGLAR